MYVSVVVPVYNVEKYAKEMICSLIQQTMKQIEFLIVDDGSTDASMDIIQAEIRNDTRFVILQQANKGAAHARNTGIQHATGEYIMFIDADDKLAKDAATLLYQEGITSGADIVYGKMKRFTTEKEWYLESHLGRKIYAGKEKNILANSELFYSIGPCAKLFAKHLFEKIKFPEHIIFGEDQYVTFMSYVSAQKIIFLNEDIYFYRIREVGERSLTQKKEEYPFAYLNSLINLFQLISQGFEKNTTFLPAEKKAIMHAYFERLIEFEIFPIFKLVFKNRRFQSRGLENISNFFESIDNELIEDSSIIVYKFIVELNNIFFILQNKSYRDYVTLQRLIIESNPSLFENEIKKNYFYKYLLTKKITTRPSNLLAAIKYRIIAFCRYGYVFLSSKVRTNIFKREQSSFGKKYRI